jgi:hypothetical protein
MHHASGGEPFLLSLLLKIAIAANLYSFIHPRRDSVVQNSKSVNGQMKEESEGTTEMKE